MMVKAGCELDRLVAEKVMEWLAKDFCGKNTCWEKTAFDEITLVKADFRPSTNITDAWLVVERMKGDGCWCEIFFNNVKKHYGATFARDGGKVYGTATTETAPLAICLAALRAKGVKVDV